MRWEGGPAMLVEEGEVAVSSSNIGKWLNTLEKLSKVKDTEI